jgi:hypothetical protein
MCLISLGVFVTVAKVWGQIAKTRQSAKMLQPDGNSQQFLGHEAEMSAGRRRKVSKV